MSTIHSAIQPTTPASNDRDCPATLVSTNVVRVPIAMLVIAGSPRLAGHDADHVQTLSESITALPPIIVHRATMRVIDGIHRLHAAQRRGSTAIDVLFFDGDDNDAFVLSVQRNTQHGLPLTRADRKAAAQRILAIHPHWSDRAIAKVTGLSPKTVASLRPRPDHPGVEVPTVRVGLDGRTRPIDHRTSHRRARDYLARHPTASTHDVAHASGLSTGSARTARRTFTDEQNTQTCPGPPPAPRHPALPATGATVAEADQILRALRSDPSLRFTDGGRAFLQLLGMSQLWEQNADLLIDNLPPHCIRTLTQAIRSCAQTFHTVADKLDARQTNLTTPGATHLAKRA